MTVPQAARYAGRNPETIRRWIREGKLKSQRVGTQHLVMVEDLAAMLSDPPLALPHHWQNADTGSMPPWEQLVRDGRESH
ncbi:MAG: helix-turn-helix domain-containing protein [bacterium]